MPEFGYKGLNGQGQQATGVVTAPSRAAAIDQVISQGLYPLAMEERQPEAPGPWIPFRRAAKVSPAQVEAFTRELSNLLGAGVSLGRALELLSEEASSANARKIWSAIQQDVMDGATLTSAMAKWPGTFSAVNVAMVRAGETGGFLDVVLGQIADFRVREQDLLGKVKAAVIYPVILAVLLVGVLIFLLTFFIPRFQVMFDEFGQSLPFLTQIIVGLSHLVLHYGIFVAFGLFLVFVWIRRTLATDAGKRFLERLLLKTPGVGTVLARFALVRFCRMLGTLVGAGVPLVSALRVAREAIGNQTLSDAVDEAVDQVQAGESLARSLSSCPALFPGAVIEMISVAEESGRLDTELVRQSAAYETDLDRRLRLLVTIAEPALLFVMAALVGTIVVGMLLPIFSLQELIK